MTIERLLTLATVAVSIAIGYFLGLATPESVAPEPWLYRWQTLITGLLAIAAAGLTVFEMQRTDERQQKRHEDLIRLSLRSDRLKATRAAFPLAEHIRNSVAEVERVYSELAKMTGSINGPENAPHVDQINSIINRFKLIMNDDQIESASTLFGPNMIHNYRAIKMNSEHVKQSLAIAIKFHEPVTLINGKTANDFFCHILEMIKDTISRLYVFADDLVALAHDYE